MNRRRKQDDNNIIKIDEQPGKESIKKEIKNDINDNKNITEIIEKIDV